MPGTFEYRNGTGALTDISDCDSITGWTNDGFNTFEAGGDFTANRQEGTNLIEMDESAVGFQSCAYDVGSGNEIDMTTEDITFWFFYTAKSEQVLGTANSCVVRVYSDATRGSNYAEWDLTGDTEGNLYPVLVKSWNRFLISGQSPTRTAGTTPDYTSIRWVELRLDINSPNTQTGDPDLAMDWWKRGDVIRVTAGTSGSPADFDSMDEWDKVDPADPANDPGYGLVEKVDVFVSLWAGVDIGDNSTSTYFAAENTFIFNDQFSGDHQHDWRVRDNATLRLGKLDIGAEAEYAINGCLLVSPEVTRDNDGYAPVADFTVQGGDGYDNKLLAYATKFFRWKNVLLGESGGSAGEIDLVDCDFDACENIEFRSSTLKIKNCKFHDPSGDGYLGSIFVAPESIEGVQIFNCVRGFQFKSSITVQNYVATDNTFDLVVDDGLTVTLTNSTFNPDKILQV